mgnify:CR=1 FL=1
MFASTFSVIRYQYVVPENMQMKCMQSDVQLKEKFIQVYLLNFYKLHLPKEKYSALHEHALFMMPLLGSTYICKQIFFHLKNTKNKIRTILDEHLKNTLRIATVCIKPDIDDIDFFF